MTTRKSLKIAILILLLSQVLYAQSNFSGTDAAGKKGQVNLYSTPTYANINDKPWDQILMENDFKWRPPYTVHLPIQPVNSPDWVHVDGALNVCRRYLTPNVSFGSSYTEAKKQETFIVQFAFEDPPFVPDFHTSTLSLADNKYPVVTADYYSARIYYQIEYMVSPVSGEQSLLWINVTVTNENNVTQLAHVRSKINFQRENDLFDYHYIPFYWDAGKWLPCDRVKLKNNSILKDDRIIGKVVRGSMECDWESGASFQDKDYLVITRNSDFVLPQLRLKNVQDVIHAKGELKPGETKTFSLALLVNYNNITENHLSFLENSSAKECREQALNHFKDQFTRENTEMTFAVGNWQDIFTALQISTLQLLVKHPDMESLMPTQGGSTERFFVWVWEAVHMLRPMLRTGHFEPVRKGLDYIFSFQDAGVPPRGNFNSTEGYIGTHGQNWMNTTGSALALATDYYIYTNDKDFLDKYLPKILKASRWIVGEIRATRKLNPDGTRPLYYGLMPYGHASDSGDGNIVHMTDAYTFWGLEKTVLLLERIKYKDVAELRRELELYRNDISAAIDSLKLENARFAYTGLINPESPLFQSFITSSENKNPNNYFKGNMDREIAYMGESELVWQHIYLSTGQWKKAFTAAQTNLKYGMTQDAYQVQERFSRRDPAFTCWQPNGSGNGRIMDMILNSLYFESERGVTLLGGIPFAWLQANKITSLRNLYTTLGKINLEITATGLKECTVSLSSADVNALPRTIRFPEYLHAIAKGPSIVNKGKGFFEVTDQRNILIFNISNE